MVGRRSGVVAIVTLCSVLIAAAAGADPIRAWGTCSAQLSEDPRFNGLWEYTLSLGWDSTGWEPYRVEQIALFVDLAECPCAAEPAYFSFPFTEGIGQDEQGQSRHYYYTGYFAQDGFAPFPNSGPAIVFHYVDTNSTLNVRGTARLVFLSEAEPVPFGAFPDHLGAVIGPHRAQGEVTGLVPSCDCGSSPAEPGTTWSLIKAIFK